MKRNKPPTMPTRVMPKRNSTRQPTVPAENPPAAAAVKKRKQRSRSSEGSRARPKTLPRVDDGGHSMSTNEHVAASGRGSPDANCSICLCAIDNRAFTDSCYHTFCFKCLLEWSRVRAVCPLCKKSFSAIVHDFLSYDNYQIYKLPRPQDQIDDADRIQLRISVVDHTVQLGSRSGLLTSRTPPMFSPIGFWVSPDNRASRQHHAEQMVAFRRRVYIEELQLQAVWSATGQIVAPSYISPSLFSCSPSMIERVRPWIMRDLHVIVSRQEVTNVCNLVINLLRQFNITSEEFYEQLFPHLGLSTRLFQQELDSFARSPYDLATYDELAVYNLRSAMTERPASNHVEDISSSDDSDVEITRSETLAVRPQADIRPVLQPLRDLFSAFQGHMWSNMTAGWDSPIPGPSGFRFIQPQVQNDDSLSSSSTEDISMIEDLQSESNETSDNHATTVSDCDSDIVVVASHRSNSHSPILLSSDNDDEITVLGPSEETRVHRRHRKRRKGCVINSSPVHVEVPSTGSGDDLGNSGEGASEQSNQMVDSNESETNKETHLPKSHRSKSRSRSRNRRRRSSGSCEVSSSSKAIDSKMSVENGVCSNELSNTNVDRHIRTKRPRNTSSFDAEEGVRSNSDDLKQPACKKHISGHKSSKRKLSDATLDTCSINQLEVGVSKSKMVEEPESSSCNADGESTTVASGPSDHTVPNECPESTGVSAITNDDCIASTEGNMSVVTVEVCQQVVNVTVCSPVLPEVNAISSLALDKVSIAMDDSTPIGPEHVICSKEDPCSIVSQHVNNDLSLMENSLVGSQAGHVSADDDAVLTGNKNQCLLNICTNDELQANVSSEHSSSSMTEAFSLTCNLTVNQIMPELSVCSEPVKLFERFPDADCYSAVGNTYSALTIDSYDAINMSPSDDETRTSTIFALDKTMLSDLSSSNVDKLHIDMPARMTLVDNTTASTSVTSNVTSKSDDDVSYHRVMDESSSSDLSRKIDSAQEVSNSIDDEDYDKPAHSVPGADVKALINTASQNLVQCHSPLTPKEMECIHNLSSHPSVDDKDVPVAKTSVHVIEDSDEDDDCISVGMDVESSDSEVEWLPDTRVASSSSLQNCRRPQRCISVSSDESDNSDALFSDITDPAPTNINVETCSDDSVDDIIVAHTVPVLVENDLQSADLIIVDCTEPVGEVLVSLTRPVSSSLEEGACSDVAIGDIGHSCPADDENNAYSDDLDFASLTPAILPDENSTTHILVGYAGLTDVENEARLVSVIDKVSRQSAHRGPDTTLVESDMDEGCDREKQENHGALSIVDQSISDVCNTRDLNCDITQTDDCIDSYKSTPGEQMLPVDLSRSSSSPAIMKECVAVSDLLTPPMLEEALLDTQHESASVTGKLQDPSCNVDASVSGESLDSGVNLASSLGGVSNMLTLESDDCITTTADQLTYCRDDSSLLARSESTDTCNISQVTETPTNCSCSSTL